DPESVRERDQRLWRTLPHAQLSRHRFSRYDDPSDGGCGERKNRGLPTWLDWSGRTRNEQTHSARVGPHVVSLARRAAWALGCVSSLLYANVWVGARKSVKFHSGQR